jgi:protein Mpv17
MPSPLLTVTLQAALFSLASTLLAQCITMYRAQTLGPINATSLIQFMLIAILMTPPNYGFQKWLEGRWPARPAGRGQLDGRTGIEKGNGKLDVGNTAKKFILDQSLGAAANTAGFIVLLNLLRGHGLHAATREVQKVSPCPALPHCFILTTSHPL